MQHSWTSWSVPVSAQGRTPCAPIFNAGKKLWTAARELMQLNYAVMPDFLSRRMFLQFAESACPPPREKRQQAQFPFLQPFVRIQE